MKGSVRRRAGAVPRRVLTTVWICVASTSHAQSRASVPRVTGCWQASRPLGPTGGALAVPRDAPFATMVLRDSGRVVLPLLADRERTIWERRSYWQVQGDSISLAVFTGLQGWRAQLSVPERSDVMRGRATYLTDAIVANAAPLTVDVTLSRITCERAWTDLRITTPLPRSWERGEAVYFEFQVERPAALVADARLPDGVRSMRAMGLNETPDARGDRPEVVVAQFIVQPNGRADTSAVKLLDAHGERRDPKLHREIATLLASVRFTPPMVGGKAVHQSAEWRIERFGN